MDQQVIESVIAELSKPDPVPDQDIINRYGITPQQLYDIKINKSADPANPEMGFGQYPQAMSAPVAATPDTIRPPNQAGGKVHVGPLFDFLGGHQEWRSSGPMEETPKQALDRRQDVIAALSRNPGSSQAQPPQPTQVQQDDYRLPERKPLQGFGYVGNTSKEQQAFLDAEGKRAETEKSIASGMVNELAKRNSEIESSQKRIAEINARREKEADRLLKEYESESEKLQALDPKKAADEVFGKGALGFMNRVAASIAVSMGAYGAALGRTKNFAQESIDRAIDMEIEKQKSQIVAGERRKADINNLLAQYNKKYGDAEAAEMLARSTMLQQSLNQIEAYKLGGVGVQADAKVAELKYSLAENEKKYRAGAYQRIFENQLKLRELETREDYMALQSAMKMKKAMMDSSQGGSISPANRKYVIDRNKALGDSIIALDQIKMLYKEKLKGNAFTNYLKTKLPDSLRSIVGEDTKSYEDMANILKVKIGAGQVQFGVLSDQERKFLMDILPNPKDGEELAMQKLANSEAVLKKMINDHAGAIRGLNGDPNFFLGKDVAPSLSRYYSPQSTARYQGIGEPMGSL